MRIHLAADHAGYTVGRALEKHLTDVGHEVVWHAAAEFDDGDDYPLFAIHVAQAVIADEDDGTPTRGVVVGASGAGECIAANKVNGARAVAAATEGLVRDARRHADADILTLGSTYVDEATAIALVDAFIEEPFADLLEDARRIIYTNEFENSGTIEGWMVD
jgi:ribose 5-phosphate isomerase B